MTVYAEWLAKQKVWQQIEPEVIEAAAQWLADIEEEIDHEFEWMKLPREENLVDFRRRLNIQKEHFTQYGHNLLWFRTAPRNADWPDGILWTVFLAPGLAIGYRKPGYPEIIYVAQPLSPLATGSPP